MRNGAALIIGGLMGAALSTFFFAFYLFTFALLRRDFLRRAVGQEVEVGDGVFGREHGVVGLAVAARDDAHVSLRLAEGRHALVLLDRAFARVVAGERQRHVAAEVVQEPAQVLRARLDVRLGVAEVVAAEALGRRRHDLHQALRADVRDGRLVVARLLPDDRVNNARVNALALTDAQDAAVAEGVD